MPGRTSLVTLSALAMLVSLRLHAEDESRPCATGVDVKAPEWFTSCEAAIAKEADPKRRAPLLFGRAFGAVERFHYDDALADLNAALAAEPENPDYLRERAFVHGVLSNYREAIDDLDRFIKQYPEDPSGYRERAYARHFNADLKGAYEDYARVLELTPDAPKSLLARAEAALWLGRFDEASANATVSQTRAQAFHEVETLGAATELLARIHRWRDTARGGDAMKRCKQAKAVHKGSASKLIGDCSRAFLEASTGGAKADALTNRSVAWLAVAESPKSATEDMRMALAFDPANPERRINLGYSYLASSESAAASREFNRVLANEKHWLALAGRAVARANLGDTEDALADALESRQMHPNEVATTVLADIAFEKGDRDRARELYLELYRLGTRNNRLFDRLNELGVPDPERVPAQ